MLSIFRRLMKSDKGATAIEYTLIASLIAVAAIVAMGSVGVKVNGKIDDTHGAISEACQMLSMFQLIATKAGPSLNNANWTNAVNAYGNIAMQGLGPYASVHTGKYTADDTWRLQEYDSTLGDSGEWKPITPVQNISS